MDTSSPSPSCLACSRCDTFLNSPILILTNCGHAIHEKCYSFSSVCRICKRLVIGACPDSQFEKTIWKIKKISTTIFKQHPSIDLQSLKRHILFEAVEKGERAVVLLLLSDKVPADTKVHGISLLYKACETSQPGIVKILLENKANCILPNDMGQTPLHYCIAAQREDLVLLFLEHGARFELRKTNDLSLFSQAVVSGLHKVVKKLIEMGALVTQDDFQGYFPLLLAAEKSDPSMIELLLKNGATSHINKRRIGGETPIEAAERAGKTENVQILKMYLEKETSLSQAPSATGGSAACDTTCTEIALAHFAPPLTLLVNPAPSLEVKMGCLSCLKQCSLL